MSPPLRTADLTSLRRHAAGLTSRNADRYKSVKGRPGIQKVLEMVKRGEVDAVIVYKLDRLARNTIECLEMAKLMDASGVALHSISEKLDTQSAMGKFFFTLTASLAEMERNIISERTAAALAQKRLTGEKTGGYTPFGFTFREIERPNRKPLKVLERDNLEQVAIARIHELRAKGYSFRQIAAELNREGRRTKTGAPWSHRQVARLYQRAA